MIGIYKLEYIHGYNKHIKETITVYYKEENHDLVKKIFETTDVDTALMYMEFAENIVFTYEYLSFNGRHIQTWGTADLSKNSFTYMNYMSKEEIREFIAGNIIGIFNRLKMPPS